MDGAMGTSLWGVAGAIYALSGAALIWAGVLGAQKPAALLAGTPANEGSSQLDARIGAALLTVGFFLQATGAVGGAKLHEPAVLLLVGLAAGLLFYGVGKDMLIEAPAPTDVSVPGPAQELIAKPILIAHVEHAEKVEDSQPEPLRQIN